MEFWEYVEFLDVMNEAQRENADPDDVDYDADPLGAADVWHGRR